MIRRCARSCLSALLLMVSGLASSAAHAQFFSSSLPVVVAGPEEEKRTLVFDLYAASGPSITRRLYAKQSTDGGATYSAWVEIPIHSPGAQPRIVTSFQTGPSLLLSPQGGYLLFFHLDGTGFSNIWRDVSADGLNFNGTTLVDLGWPDPGGTMDAGSTYPSVVIDGASSMTMLYQQFAADGPFPVGLYVSRSSDLGLSWSPTRSLVATDADLHGRPMLVHRPDDGRYVAAYVVSPATGDSRVLVRTTTSPLDWSAAPVLEVQGDSHNPALVVMSDGAFVLLYSRTLGNQRDLFSRRSVDGLTWQAERQLTDSPENNDWTPFGLATDSPGAIELYWSRSPDLTSGGSIASDLNAVVLDPVFGSGFDG